VTVDPHEDGRVVEEEHPPDLTTDGHGCQPDLVPEQSMRGVAKDHVEEHEARDGDVDA